VLTSHKPGQKRQGGGGGQLPLENGTDRLAQKRGLAIHVRQPLQSGESICGSRTVGQRVAAQNSVFFASAADLRQRSFFNN
jgi:hypothetical protein